MSKERPIIFTGESVRAILDGRKSQTRRVIKPQPRIENGWFNWGGNRPKSKYCTGAVSTYPPAPNTIAFHCSYGQVGDRLWVKEDYKYLIQGDMVITYYKTSYEKDRVKYTLINCLDEKTKAKLIKGKQGVWKSKLLMFKFMVRIWLEITGIRVERIQDIDAVEAEAEGARRPKRLCPDRHDEYILERFQRLWDSINAKRGFSWDANPYVWVIEFKRIKI